MSKKLYEEEYIQAIADSIRSKNGSTDTYKLSEMSTAIDDIETGGSAKKKYFIKDGVFQEEYQNVYVGGTSSQYGKITFGDGYVNLASRTWSEFKIVITGFSNVKSGDKLFLEFSKPAYSGSNYQYGSLGYVGNDDSTGERHTLIDSDMRKSYERQINTLVLPKDYSTIDIRYQNLCGVSDFENYGIKVYNFWLESTAPEYEEKSLTINDNGTYEVTPSEGYDAILKATITVDVSGGSSYTGHVDTVGLKAIGWTDDDIQYLQDNVFWNEEDDDLYSLSSDDLENVNKSSLTKYRRKNSSSNIRNSYKMISLPYEDMSSKTNMSNLFDSCYNLCLIPQLDTSNTTKMNSMFNYCGNLKTIPLLDTSNVTTMQYMFNGCMDLETIPLLDTSNVNNMISMFYNCYNLKTIPLLDTSNVNSMASMFYNCYNLKTIPLLDTSNVNSMASMFCNCYKLNKIPLLDCSKAETVSYMFEYCRSLSTIPLLNIERAINMQYMFGHSGIMIIPKLNTSNANNISYTFYECRSLITVPELDASKVTNLYNVFYACYELKNLGGLKNLGQSYSTSTSANYYSNTLDLIYPNNLTHDSLMNVINNLYDIATAGCNTQKLTLGGTNLEKLTADEVAIATAKGWTVS